MCGRYVVAGHQELSERFQLRQLSLRLAPTYNAAPSQQLPVVLEDERGERVVRLLQWGLRPRWQKPGAARSIAPINARAETLLDKPLFRPLVGHRRCIVPANGFYEWQRTDGRKQPYYLTTTDGSLLGFAGLYDEAADPDGEALGSYAIITTAANPLVVPLHERMPAILRADDEAEWLSRDVTDPHQVERLLHPYPAEAMVAYPVGTAVNNVRHDGPDLIEPAR